MRILFDQCVPVPLRQALADHRTTTVHEQGWSRLKDGELVDAAEAARFDVLVTTNPELRAAQRSRQHAVATVVLGSASWPRIRRALPQIVRAIEGAGTARNVEVAVP